MRWGPAYPTHSGTPPGTPVSSRLSPALGTVAVLGVSGDHGSLPHVHERDAEIQGLGRGSRAVSSAAHPTTPPTPPPHASPPRSAPPRPHLDDVTVAQGERQLRLLLHPRAVLQRGLQLDRDHLALGRAAGARWAWDQRLLPQQPVPCQGEGADSLSQSSPDGWLPLRGVAEHQGTAEISVTPLPLPGQVTPRLWAPVSPAGHWA